MKQRIEKFGSLDGLSRAAADYVTGLAVEAERERGVFTLFLSGGGTPEKLYRLLARSPLAERFPWQETLLFWGDERMVPRDHEASNYRMVNEALLGRVPVVENHVYPVPTGAPDCAEAAVIYGNTLDYVFRTLDRDNGGFISGGIPRPDLVLLGLGADGHTASLFSGDRATEDTERLAAPARAPEGYEVRDRVTVTLPLINNASRAMFLVSGEGKREALESILDDPEQAAGRYPAALVRPARGELLWFVDSQALP